MLDNFDRLARLLAEKGRPDPVAVATTDATGRYCVRLPPAGGVWRLEAHAPSLVPMQYFPLPLPAGLSVELPPVRLPLDVGTRVEVLDTEGEPIRAAVYSKPTQASFWNGLARDGWSVVSRFGWTDGHGLLALPRADRERLDLSVLHPGFGMVVRAHDMEGARFLLPPPRGSSLKLRFHSAGEVVDDAIVALGDAAWPVGRSNAAGEVLVRGLRSRLVSLLVVSSGGDVVRKAVYLRDLPPGEPLSVELARPGRIVGRVTDSANTPIPGALVWIGRDPGRFAVSDQEGRFELAFPTTERFWIQIHAAGFSPRRRTLDPKNLGGTDLFIVLDPSRTIQGRVVDSRGMPVARAMVTGSVPGRRGDEIFRLDPVSGRSVTGATGQFVVEVPSSEDCRLEATKEGFHLSMAQVGAHRPAGSEVVIHLSRLAAGRGRVLDRNGDPLSGVRVHAFPTGAKTAFSILSEVRRSSVAAKDASEAVETDASGLFELQSLPADAIDLAAYKLGFAPAVVRDIRSGGAEGAVDLGTLVLVRGIPLEGHVVDSSGLPVHGAQLWQIDPSARTGRGRLDQTLKRDPDAVCSEDGHFVLADLVEGKAVRLAADATGYRRSVVDLVEVPAEAEPIDIVLERDVVLRGRVVDPDGVPMPDVRIVAHARGAESGTIGPDVAVGTEGVGLSGDDGSFEVEELEPGKYELRGYLEGYLETDPWPVDVLAGEVVEGIELRLRNGAEVQGWVLDDNGLPVEGATVVMGRPAARTDEDGEFSARGVETGPTTISVRHPDYVWAQREVEIEPGVNRVEMVLSSGVAVEGEVRTPDGRGLDSVVVVLTGESSPYREYSSLSGQDGRFELEHVQPGTYAVETREETMVPVLPEQRVQVGAQGLQDLVVELRPGASISGYVRGVDLDELALLRVEATSFERPPRKGAVSHSGEYRIGSVAPGVWWVRARLAGGSREAEARVVVTEDASEVTQDLDLGAGLEMRGRVLFDTEPIPEASISVTGLGVALSRTGRTDLEGRFSFGNLTEGRYRITVSDLRRMLVHNEIVDLYVDRDVEVRIEAGRVQGTVLSATAGEPVPDALVMLGQLEGVGEEEVSRVTVGTDPRGEFRIAHLSAGTYRLSVRRDGFIPVERRIDLHGGQSLELRLELETAAGLRIGVRSAVGQRPPWASVEMHNLDTGERIAEVRPVKEGFVEIPTAAPGRWSLLLAAPRHAPARLQASVPGPAAEVVLQPADRLSIQVPRLDEQKLTATVRVLSVEGEVLTGLDEETGGLRTAWPWRRGGIVIDGVPAGQWIVEVSGVDGSSWSRVVTTAGGGEQELLLE